MADTNEELEADLPDVLVRLEGVGPQRGRLLVEPERVFEPLLDLEHAGEDARWGAARGGGHSNG